MKIELNLDEMADELKERVLDELCKDGHSLREWIELIHSLDGFEEVKRLKQERDAAIRDMTPSCTTCKHSMLNNPAPHICKYADADMCRGVEHFEWRGVQEGGAPHV